MKKRDEVYAAVRTIKEIIQENFSAVSKPSECPEQRMKKNPLQDESLRKRTTRYVPNLKTSRKDIHNTK